MIVRVEGSGVPTNVLEWRHEVDRVLPVMILIHDSNSEVDSRQQASFDSEIQVINSVNKT